MKVGDRAIFKGGDIWLTDLDKYYKNSMCTILEIRSTPFDDCKVAFDNFPKCNYRDLYNWYFVEQRTLEVVS